MKLEIQKFGGRGATSGNTIDYSKTYSKEEIAKFSNKRLTDEIRETQKLYDKYKNTKNTFDGRTYNGRMERIFNRSNTTKYEIKLEWLKMEQDERKKR